MPEVVSQIVAVVFQHVEALVLDLPTGPGAGRGLHHVVRRHRQTGHESPVIGGFPRFIGDGDPQPVNRERILAVAQRNRLDPAVAISQAALAGLALDHRALVQRRSIHILVQRLVAVPLAHE